MPPQRTPDAQLRAEIADAVPDSDIAPTVDYATSRPVYDPPKKGPRQTAFWLYRDFRDRAVA